MGTTYAIKGKAKNFMASLFESDSEDDGPSLPARPVAVTPDPGLTQQFGGLNIGGSPAPKPYPYHRPHYSQPNVNAADAFVGGFNPATSPRAEAAYRANPPAPNMLVPYGSTQSLTMQHALLGTPPPFRPPDMRLDPNAYTPFRPNSSPNVPQHTSMPVASGGGPTSASPAKPTKKSARQRSNSTPSTPLDANASSNPNQTQCSGFTQNGERCKRQVKVNKLALSNVFKDDQSIDHYCFQHVKALKISTGFYAQRKDDKWVAYDDYIPNYLHPDTQVALRVEMEKLRSASDVEGYIYTFEIRDPTLTSTIKLKVGRTVNVVKRLNQWGKQCGSKEQVLRGWYPGAVDEDDDTANGSLMKGRIQAGGQGVWCHRLERLIHLELADLAVNKAYLNPEWRAFTKGQGRGKYQKPQLSTLDSDDSNTTPKKKKNGFKASSGIGNGGYLPCKDCGTIHKEIFEFERVLKGPYKGQEFDKIVKKVVDEWGEFVKNYV